LQGTGLEDLQARKLAQKKEQQVCLICSGCFPNMFLICSYYVPNVFEKKEQQVCYVVRVFLMCSKYVPNVFLMCSKRKNTRYVICICVCVYIYMTKDQKVCMYIHISVYIHKKEKTGSKGTTCCFM
jgi:hypothetical protein